MNGYEVLEHLKASSELRDVPVIVFSGLDEMDSVIKCIEPDAEGLSRQTIQPDIAGCAGRREP
jgi:adenylate cyclase